MPKGTYKRTEKHKEQLRQRMKGNIIWKNKKNFEVSDETRKKNW